MSQTSHSRRVIQVNKGIIGPAEPRPKTVRARKLADYPRVAVVHREVARKLSNPLLLGPPICDELMAFVEHTFTEEEARAVRRLSAVRRRTAEDVARAERVSLEVIEPTLERLAFAKRAIGCHGPPDKRSYTLMPIMPGIFEMVLIGEAPEAMSDWHRRFAELYEALFETGYFADYYERRASMIRYLPLGQAIGAHPMALPCDQLEVVLDRFDCFGVGYCQCRKSTPPVGEGCGKPLQVCTVMGKWAKKGIKAGWLRSISKRELLEVKREAESHGLVTWMMNVESTKGQASCSCCGCCCKAMRTATEFSTPGFAAPPHFMPRFDREKCSSCGQCARNCPTGAITVDTQQKTLAHQPARCIGCGLCRIACDRQRAVAMEAAPEYRLPYKSWFSMLLGAAPGYLRTSWNVWRAR